MKFQLAALSSILALTSVGCGGSGSPDALPPAVHASAAIQATLPPAGYTLAWSDEFNGLIGTYPNPSNWAFDLGAGGWGNREQETYTSTNATIVADQAASDGTVLDIASSKVGKTYYSSRLKTQGLRTFQYGYIEVRAKVPPGGPSYQGYWPAIWTLGADITTSGWPKCGEIDIMEHLCGTNPKRHLSNGARQFDKRPSRMAEPGDSERHV